MNIYKNFIWRENELSTIVELEKGNKVIARTKYVLLLLAFIPLLIYQTIVEEPIFEETKYHGIWCPEFDFHTLYLWATAYVIIHMTAFILHYSVYSSINRKYQFKDDDSKPLYVSKRHKKDIFSKKKMALSLLITPDYYWANFFKDRLESKATTNQERISVYQTEVTKILKKYFIERSNWWNIMITIIASMMILVLFGHFDYLTGPGSYFILIIVVLRIGSRSIEILFAFYNDVVVQRDKMFFSTIDEEKKFYLNSWKNSSILSFGRVSLALHSLVEVFMIFSILYLLMDNLNNLYIFDSPKDIVESKVGIMTYFIYSFSNTITFPDPKLDSFWAIAQTVQLLTSAVLILLSLASYIGKDQQLKQHEEELFIELKSRL